jgi:uncharacterized protein (TIGR03083 family)
MDLNREELEALLGAYAIDALDDAERAQLEDLLGRDQLLARRATELQEVAAALVDDLDGEAPPPRVAALRRAVGQRAPGRHLANPLGPELPPAELWRRQFAELDALLGQLRPGDWAATTSFDRSVHELLAHLTAVLDQYAAEIGAGTFAIAPGTPLDHWGITEPRIAELTALDPDVTVARLREIGGRLGAFLAGVPAEQFTSPRKGYMLTLADRTRLQCFELWMHTDDVRRATGRALVDPDAERICALSDLSARFVGLGMLVTGRDHPGRRGRLVLTGPGGGTWRVALAAEDPPSAEGSAGSDDDVVVIADAIDYCRMAGRLLAIEELAIVVEGDPSLALDVLAGAQAYAV